MKLRACCVYVCVCVYKFVAIQRQTHPRTTSIFEYETPSLPLPPPLSLIRSYSAFHRNFLCAVLASIESQNNNKKNSNKQQQTSNKYALPNGIFRQFNTVHHRTHVWSYFHHHHHHRRQIMLVLTSYAHRALTHFHFISTLFCGIINLGILERILPP